MDLNLRTDVPASAFRNRFRGIIRVDRNNPPRIPTNPDGVRAPDRVTRSSRRPPGH